MVINRKLGHEILITLKNQLFLACEKNLRDLRECSSCIYFSPQTKP